MMIMTILGCALAKKNSVVQLWVGGWMGAGSGSDVHLMPSIYTKAINDLIFQRRGHYRLLPIHPLLL